MLISTLSTKGFISGSASPSKEITGCAKSPNKLNVKIYSLNGSYLLVKPIWLATKSL